MEAAKSVTAIAVAVAVALAEGAPSVKPAPSATFAPVNMVILELPPKPNDRRRRRSTLCWR